MGREFRPLLGNDEIERLDWLDRRKQAAENVRRAIYTALGWICLFGGTALIVFVAALHPEWPW